MFTISFLPTNRGNRQIGLLFPVAEATDPERSHDKHGALTPILGSSWNNRFSQNPLSNHSLCSYVLNILLPSWIYKTSPSPLIVMKLILTNKNQVAPTQGPLLLSAHCPSPWGVSISRDIMAQSFPDSQIDHCPRTTCQLWPSGPILGKMMLIY